MMFVFMLLSYLYFFKITNQNLRFLLKIWEKCNKYQNNIYDSPLSSISAQKSDQFVPKVSNDICMENLSLVRYDWTENKVLNISSDICDETFRFISADKSDQFIPKVSNDICIELLIFVRSEGTEKKLQNISSDICDKTFRFISADKAGQYRPRSAIIVVSKTSS